MSEVAQSLKELVDQLQRQVNSSRWPIKVRIGDGSGPLCSLATRPSEWTMWPLDRDETTRVAEGLWRRGVTVAIAAHPESSFEESCRRVCDADRIEGGKPLRFGKDEKLDISGIFDFSLQPIKSITLLADFTSDEDERHIPHTLLKSEVDEDSKLVKAMLDLSVAAPWFRDGDPCDKGRLGWLCEIESSVTNEMKNLYEQLLNEAIARLSGPGEVFEQRGWQVDLQTAWEDTQKSNSQGSC